MAWLAFLRSKKKEEKEEFWDQPIEISTDLTGTALDSYYKQIVSKLISDMAFLRYPVRRMQLTSNILKGAALIALGLGLLLPILIVDDVKFLWGNRSGAELALAAVITGGLLLFADQLFNVSRSWQRLMLSELQVKNVRQTLEMEWAKRRPFVTDAGMATEGVALLDLLASALRNTNVIMVAQKQTWTTELDQAMADLRARFEAQRGTLAQTVQAQKDEAAKPTTGAINVAIDKPEGLKGPVQLSVDGKKRGEWAIPSGSLSVGEVPVGMRIVELTAKRTTPADQAFVFSLSLKVEPGAPVTFQVKV